MPVQSPMCVFIPLHSYGRNALIILSRFPVPPHFSTLCLRRSIRFQASREALFFEVS